MFKIYDCSGQVVGNPGGYKSVQQACRVANNKRTKAYNAIWSAFYARTNSHDKLVWEVK